MTPEQFDEMRDLLERTDKADNVGDVKLVVELSKEFNDMIYRFAKMPRLDVIVKKLRQYLVRFRDISLTEDNRRRKALDEHWLLYKYMKKQDKDMLTQITSEHLDFSEKFILMAMEKLEAEQQKADEE
ncbi:FCD domain-containing protein [Proteiniclasticum ruminis]|uniref:FCD domain-containing protein n=1 Tax=Proteiniclasticum ruminis TaxID=398199 RepID=A0A1G8RLJ6_9CLOT|nr:FCD domain-containing protein [Proteiniclasticum ruminis]SDJ17857.1 FCD domain-containing protein [Proteiniclasticum ruminis]